MPLRDHFRPPVSTKSSWEGFHGMWPALIVQRLVKHLPENFTAEPRVHIGAMFEVDVSAYEDNAAEVRQHVRQIETHIAEGSGGGATAAWAAPAPTSVAEVDLVDQFEYEVLVYEQSRGRHLVAAVELVSPANKDRLDSRRAFVAKCATLLQQKVCVCIVDLVTTRNFNLYAELMELAGQFEATSSHTSPAAALPAPMQSSTYAVSLRGRNVKSRPRIEAWAYPLAIADSLPTLPLWLTEDQSVPLELEASYEDTCQVLRVDR
jgi:hypothetical protein